MSSPWSIPKSDRISALPDSVICHILSFLPTKLAVTTSILSKRWTPLWRSVLTLDFDEKSFKGFTSFRLFVYSIIVSRDLTLPVTSFRIRCGECSEFDARDLNRFVLAALQRGLQNFDLYAYCLRFDDVKKLSLTILRVLSCRTLVVLKLKNLCLQDVPNLVDLPLLKTLRLAYILVEHVHLINLFNGCPILEDLHINNLEISWENESIKGFKGFPNLVRANLRDCQLTFPFDWFYNAKFMSVNYVDVAEESIDEYPFSTFHNLTHVELLFYSLYPEEWVIQLLQYCSKLQNLIIDEGDMYEEVDEEVVEVEDWEDPETVPECLSSQLRTCSLRSFKGNQCELHLAEYIMLNSKILRSMTIETIKCNLVDEKAKHQMLKKLSSYPRGSVTCKLLFD